MKYQDVTMQVVRANPKEPWATKLQEAWFANRVRLLAALDTDFQLEDLKGDTYNRKVNPDVPEERMAREELEFEERVERQGVYGLIGEVRTDETTWEHVDSCWGFVGEDYLNSGYDADIAQAVIQKAKKLR